MLRPTPLTTALLGLATKPGLGYEQQLYVSTLQSTNLGLLLVAGANSGVYTPNVADNNTLLGAPQELLCVLNNDVADSGPIVITVNGLDSTSAALTCTATFVAPNYANEQGVVFPKSYAVELVPTVDGKLMKQILSVSIACTSLAQYAQFKILGVPSIASYKKIGTKVTLNYDPKVPMPTAIQDGRDLGAFIKAGNIDIGTLEISGKVATSADGLARYNGVRVTGLIKEVKEDKLGTQNIFVTGLIMTSKVKVGEDQTPNMFDATSMFENIGFVMAPGPGQ